MNKIKQTNHDFNSTIYEKVLIPSFKAASSKKESDDKNGKYVHQERFYGHASRSFYVGDNLDTKDIEAEFKNGILESCVPKKEEAKELPEAKRIEIK